MQVLPPSSDRCAGFASWVRLDDQPEGRYLFLRPALCPLANAQTAMNEPRYTFDVATITCKQFVDLPTDVVRIGIIYWLDGYHRGDYEPTAIDTATLETARVQLADYCTKNEAHPLITAYKKLFVVGKR